MTDSNNTVTVVWNNQHGYWWNETCAIVLEVFGLPGDRYQSTPDYHYMSFTFNNQKDADLCRILLSERL